MRRTFVHVASRHVRTKSKLTYWYLFALAVERRRGVVEDEDFGVPDERAGDADALFLAARQLSAFSAHVCLVALQATLDISISRQSSYILYKYLYK